MNRAKEPFLFKTQLSLVLLTGLKAGNLLQLRNHLKAVPESSIYYHTHHFLQEHQFLVPEPPNDFAYWVTKVLQETSAGESLMAIDTVRFRSLDTLRAAIVSALDRFLAKEPKLRDAPTGQEFHFMKCILFTLPTPYEAHDLEEFMECLKKVSAHALYYHIFEARLRKQAGTNDLSDWLEDSLGETRLAKKMEKLDPYIHTLEGLRERLVYLVEERIREESHATAQRL